MKTKAFEGLVAGLGDALAYANGDGEARARAVTRTVQADRTFVAEARLPARKRSGRGSSRHASR